MTKQERFEVGEVFRFKNTRSDRVFRFHPSEIRGFIEVRYTLSSDFEYHVSVGNITQNGVSYFTSVMNKMIDGKLSFRNIEFINQ